MVSFRSHLAARKISAAPLLWLALCLCVPAAAHGADTNAVLNGWFKAQASVQSLSADFTQTRTLKTLVRPLIAHGHLWFAPPNQFRWELGHPPQTIAVRHDDEMYVIYPRLKRAEHYPLGTSAPREWRDAMSLLDAGFPRTRADFDAQFILKSLVETDGKYTLALEPRRAAARQIMPDLRVFLATNDYSLAGTQLVFMDGSSMRNDFSQCVTNAPVDEKLFHWTPPADFKVTEPFSK